MGGTFIVASFNVYWFGTAETERVVRAPADEAMIGQVIDRLDADVILFQEIVSLDKLERLLLQGRRPMRIRDHHERWVTSASVRAKDFARDLKVVMAWDHATVELLKFGCVRVHARPKGTRRPLVAHMRHIATGWEFTVVGVHMKSGPPMEVPGSREALAREAECANLVAWASGRSDVGAPFAKPNTSEVLLIGDFNAPRHHFSLKPLEEGAMTSWRWHPAALPDLPGEQWTSWLDHNVIDHIVTSPAMTSRASKPEAYAFDLDPAFDRAPPDGPGWMHRVTDFTARPRPGTTRGLIENIFRVSDHRPVRIKLRAG